DPDTRAPRDLTPLPGTPPEWQFLHDYPGYTPTPLSPPPPSSRPNVGPIAPALVPRDGYPAPERLPRSQVPPPVFVPGPMPQPLPTPPPGQTLPVPQKIEQTP
ncbi:MAG TPA: hypothetical protein VH092_27330, partial [Urbifossiella sp.]|nr:hypothetical protein [Urbifossiella sp.]